MAADPPPSGPSAPVGFMVAGSEMVAFTLLGLFLDYAFGTMPGFTIGLTILGFGAAFFQLLRMAKAFGNKKPASDSSDDSSTA